MPSDKIAPWLEKQIQKGEGVVADALARAKYAGRQAASDRKPRKYETLYKSQALRDAWCEGYDAEAERLIRDGLA